MKIHAKISSLKSYFIFPYFHTNKSDNDDNKNHQGRCKTAIPTWFLHSHLKPTFQFHLLVDHPSKQPVGVHKFTMAQDGQCRVSTKRVPAVCFGPGTSPHAPFVRLAPARKRAVRCEHPRGFPRKVFYLYSNSSLSQQNTEMLWR